MSKPSSLAEDMNDDDVAESGVGVYEPPADRGQEMWIQELSRSTTLVLNRKDADDLGEMFGTQDHGDDDDVDDKVPGNEAKKRRVQEDRVAIADMSPNLLTFLPIDTVLGNIMGYLSAQDLQRYCRAEPMFAYRFCGLQRRSTFPNDLDDTRVVWLLWRNLLARDFGISDNPNECSSDSIYFREMTASAVKIFIAHELEQGFSAPLASLEPNRARLLAYKHLYATLYNSSRSKVIHTANLNNDAAGIAHLFTLDANIVALAIDYNNREWEGYIIVSAVALISAHEDAIEQRHDLSEILYSLHKGHYGTVFESTEELLPMTRGWFRTRLGVYLLPRARWVTLEDEKALQPAFVGQNKRAVVAGLADPFRLMNFLNDAGDAILFGAHNGNPLDQNRNLSIEQYSTASHDDTDTAVSLTHRIQLGDEGDEQRNTYMPTVAQTETTYMTFACQWATRDQLLQRLRGGMRDEYVFQRGWYPRDTVLQIAKFSGNRSVFRLAIDELVQQHGLPEARRYFISATTCTHRLADGSFAGCYIIFVSVFSRDSPYDNLRARRSYHLIKINLDAAGDPLSVKLYIVPRIFSMLLDINVISSRYTSFSFDQLASPRGETAVIDWERNVAIYIPRAYSNPFDLRSHDRIMVPMLSLTNYHMTEPRVVHDNGTGNFYSSDIQMYDQATLIPTDLLFATVTKYL